MRTSESPFGLSALFGCENGATPMYRYNKYVSPIMFSSKYNTYHSAAGASCDCIVDLENRNRSSVQSYFSIFASVETRPRPSDDPNRSAPATIGFRFYFSRLISRGICELCASDNSRTCFFGSRDLSESTKRIHLKCPGSYQTQTTGRVDPLLVSSPPISVVSLRNLPGRHSTTRQTCKRVC